MIIHSEQSCNACIATVDYGVTHINQDNVKEGIVKVLYNVKQSSLGYSSVNALVDMKKKSDIDVKKYMPLFQKMELKDSKLQCKDMFVY